MLYLALAVIFLHLISLPFVISTAVYIDSDKLDGRLSVKVFGIPVFVKELDCAAFMSTLKGDGEPEDKESGKTEERKEPKTGKKIKPPFGAFTRYLIRFVKIFVTRIRVRYFGLDARIGLGDAAVTAVTVGGIVAAFSDVCAVGNIENRCAVVPDYDALRVDVLFDGIISFCFADIMYVGFAALRSKRAPSPTKSIDRKRTDGYNVTRKA